MGEGGALYLVVAWLNRGVYTSLSHAFGDIMLWFSRKYRDAVKYAKLLRRVDEMQDDIKVLTRKVVQIRDDVYEEDTDLRMQNSTLGFGYGIPCDKPVHIPKKEYTRARRALIRLNALAKHLKVEIECVPDQKVPGHCKVTKVPVKKKGKK